MRATSNKIGHVTYVNLRGVGSEHVVALIKALYSNGIHSFGASSVGGPDGNYIALHAYEDLPRIKKIWRSIYKSSKNDGSRKR